MEKQFRVTKLSPIWKCARCGNEKVGDDWDLLPPIGKREERVCTLCSTVVDRRGHVVVAYLVEAEG